MNLGRIVYNLFRLVFLACGCCPILVNSFVQQCEMKENERVFLQQVYFGGNRVDMPTRLLWIGTT